MAPIMTAAELVIKPMVAIVPDKITSRKKSKPGDAASVNSAMTALLFRQRHRFDPLPDPVDKFHRAAPITDSRVLALPEIVDMRFADPKRQQILCLIIMQVPGSLFKMAF